jgi:hypothetical protein
MACSACWRSNSTAHSRTSASKRDAEVSRRASGYADL